MASNNQFNAYRSGNDGRFPPNAENRRLTYIRSIQQMASAIRANDPTTRGDLAHLKTLYNCMEDYIFTFNQVHGDLVVLLMDNRYEKQEQQLFDQINMEASGALTLLRRRIQTLERIENPLPRPIEATKTVSIGEPKTELEQLIAANAVLQHRLALVEGKAPTTALA